VERFDLSGLKVSLVYPPYGAVKNEPGIRAVKENYGVFPSLSLLYVAGCLEQHGVEVQVIDIMAEGLSLDETVDRLQRFGPDYVGYTVTTYLFHQTMSWVKAIKKKVDVPVIAGGVHMGMYPLQTMVHDELDYGVTGEAEMTLPHLLDALRHGGDLDKLKGLIWRTSDRTPVYNGDAPLLSNISDAPWPARHLIDNSLYYSFISKYKNFSALMTSRGCPYRCIFCEQGGLKFRPRTPTDVVDEIELAVKEHGVREFDFFDSAFTIQKQRVIDICAEIDRRDLDIIWAARTRVDCVSSEMLQWMARAGCVRVYYGLESGNRNILRTLKKATDLDQAKRTIHETKDAGIDCFGYFMVGNPGETPSTVRQTIRWSLELPLTYAQFSKVTPMPGTELYKLYLEEFGEDYWERYIADEDYDAWMPRPGCSMTEAEVQAWTQLAYVRFYYRPMFAAKTIARMKSWHEIRRSVSTAWQMLIQRPEGGHYQDMDLS
jgi:anaerobic magnesium-protoporphyrin IX monomethyl ester cyclase